MRALRVVGLGIDGRTVILETVAQRSGERRERFTLPADEGLHAAVRGDLPRLGQIEIELESQMRPREIQARIRAGASVEQVASAAGVPTQRIERFAYPVLLERSRTAQLAQQAHPVRSDGPDVRTLEQVVTETFSSRGHDYETAAWDSWRGENGKWIVQLRWRAGRSDNKAHWTFHPGAHGGTVTALDDHATDLIDPQPAAQLRTVPPVVRMDLPEPDAPAPQRAVEPEGAWEQPWTREPEQDPAPQPTARTGQATPHTQQPAGHHVDHPADPDADHALDSDADRDVVEERRDARAVPDDGPAYRASRTAGSRPATPERPAPGERQAGTERSAAPERSAGTERQAGSERPAAGDRRTAGDRQTGSERHRGGSERPAAERRPAAEPAATEQDQPAAQTSPPKRGRKDRPIVPSWEDVLLGVRSPRE